MAREKLANGRSHTFSSGRAKISNLNLVTGGERIEGRRGNRRNKPSGALG